MTSKKIITLAILTKNEEKNIVDCIKPFSYIVSEIIVSDQSSTDATVPLAQSLGARVIRSSAISFGERRNECLENSKTDYVLFLDADERPDRNMISFVENFHPKDGVSSYRFARADHFWNKRLTHGEVSRAFSDGIDRLVNKNSVHFVGDVHEVAHISQGASQKGLGTIEHYPHKNINEFVTEINKYSTIRAKELQNKKSSYQVIFELIVFPPSKFWYNYLLKLGFLDGAAGFTYCFLMAFHSFLVRAKILASK
ncbi:MAG: glycosyltransferase family 2 protein [Patescibacteria group bacterium]